MTLDFTDSGFALAVLDILPNPVLVKDEETRYVWVNQAFEELFQVRREALLGRLDSEVFVDRQAAQCNGGDIRVLESGEVDEAYETVFEADGTAVETITRKIRLDVATADGSARLLVGVMHDVTEVTAANRQLERTSALLEDHAEKLRVLAETDPLTGCLNRRAIFARSMALLADGGAVLAVDVDHFKTVNDTRGHAAGDGALVALSDRVRSVLRPGDEFARLGGEEFAIVLPGASDAEAIAVAERLREAVEADPMQVSGDEVPLTVSIGVVQGGTAGEGLDSWLKEADSRLYRAKEAGRNRVVAFA